MAQPQATMMAGIPAHNMAFYRRIRFLVGDPAVLIEVPGDGGSHATLILPRYRDGSSEEARAS